MEQSWNMVDLHSHYRCNASCAAQHALVFNISCLDTHQRDTWRLHVPVPSHNQRHTFWNLRPGKIPVFNALGANRFGHSVYVCAEVLHDHSHRPAHISQLLFEVWLSPLRCKYCSAYVVSVAEAAAVAWCKVVWNKQILKSSMNKTSPFFVVSLLLYLIKKGDPSFQCSPPFLLLASYGFDALHSLSQNNCFDNGWYCSYLKLKITQTLLSHVFVCELLHDQCLVSTQRHIKGGGDKITIFLYTRYGLHNSLYEVWKNTSVECRRCAHNHL